MKENAIAFIVLHRDMRQAEEARAYLAHPLLGPMFNAWKRWKRGQRYAG